jgi:hypothetical protein
MRDDNQEMRKSRRYAIMKFPRAAVIELWELGPHATSVIHSNRFTPSPFIQILFIPRDA